MGGTDRVEEGDFLKRVLFGLRAAAKMKLNGEGGTGANTLGRGKGIAWL